MDRKKRIYAAVLAVAVLALLVDRVFLSEPESAAAALVSKPMPTVAKTVSASQPSDPSVDALNCLPTDETDRDVFLPGPAMLRESQESQQAAMPTGPQPGSPEVFAQNHHLQATFVGPTGQIAVIDGQPREQGAMIEGYTLTTIDADSVIFQGSQGIATLKLPSQNP